MYHWDHRILKIENGYAIKEVYYDETDKIHLWDNDDIIYGQILEDLKRYYEWIGTAFEKEILDEEKLLKEIRG